MKKILIIGCGFAGTSAAIKVAELCHHVILVSPMPSERAQSVMAMGGINAALNTKGENDSPHEHYLDTMAGGCYLNDPVAVKKLTDNAPATVEWLARIGVNFDRDKSRQIELRNFGGQKKKRTAYSGAHTGKQIMAALTAQCRKFETENKITRKTGWYFLSMVLDSKHECAGAVIINKQDSSMEVIPADAMIFASGAPNRVFGKTSGSVLNSGSATGLAIMQGIECANLEMIQYHPTTIETSGKRMLITEAARGAGGRLYTIRDNKRWYFMEEWYPERGALMPRDVVSRSIYKVCNEIGLKIEGKNQVYLDITHLPRKVINRTLDEVVQTCMKFIDLDPRVSPIPVYPGIHYFMGGIRTDAEHRTNIRRVFAAGECSSQYHGANRLGGNSVLGAVYGGLVAAEVSCSDPETVNRQDRENACQTALNAAKRIYEEWKVHSVNTPCTSREIRTEMAAIMNSSMGIFRDASGLEEALSRINVLYYNCEHISQAESYTDYISTKSTVLVAKAMLVSALARKESRGAHQRLDYPETNDADFKKAIVVKMVNGEIYVESREI